MPHQSYPSNPQPLLPHQSNINSLPLVPYSPPVDSYPLPTGPGPPGLPLSWQPVNTLGM